MGRGSGRRGGHGASQTTGRRLLVLRAGKHLRRDWEVLCSDYRRRIEHDTVFDDRLVKVRGDGPERRQREAEALRAALPDPCWSIALDPRGRTMDSPSLARELSRLREEWPHPVAFLIGSDLGLEPALVSEARLALSLGPMTFGHELARLMLYEQIYRALSIGRGIKYHRQPF